MNSKEIVQLERRPFIGSISPGQNMERIGETKRLQNDKCNLEEQLAKIPSNGNTNESKGNYLLDKRKQVKTNNETLELPLLIMKATTSPLIGLDWTAGKTPQH